MSRDEGYVVHEDELELEGWADSDRVRWRTLVSGDRSPTHSLTAGVAEVAGGEERHFRVHTHAQPEVYYVLSGEGLVTVSGVEHPVRAGSAVFIPGGAEHGARSTGTEPLRLFYVFAADSFADVEYEFPAG